MRGSTAVLAQPKEATFPFMIFASILGHGLALLLLFVAPSLLSGGKPEPFGGPSGSGGNVMWVTTSGLGQEGKPSPELLTQQEPAPARTIKKITAEDDVPLPSKTEFPELNPKKKPKDEPTAKETLNQRERKSKGEFGRGIDTSEKSGKSGNEGRGKTGIGTFGVGEGGPGGYGTGTGLPFPFPWYVENVLTKIELAWRKPYIVEEKPQEYNTVVYFVIEKYGKVRRIQVEKSSGIPALDRSCEAAVLGAAPFPPLPTQWTEPELAFRLIFNYTK